MGTFYKFKSLEHPEYLFDIVVKKRMYMGRFDKMNDPMEGIYYSNDLLHAELVNEKRACRFCSLSKNYRHNLMWSHYANSHYGYCVKLSINEEEYDIRKITYSASVPEYIQGITDIKRILTHKFNDWKYEREYRLFLDNSEYLNNLNITEIIFGVNVNENDYILYRDLITEIDRGIRVTRMNKDLFIPIPRNVVHNNV